MPLEEEEEKEDVAKAMDATNNFDEQIADVLTESAIKTIGEAEYRVYTTDFDVIEKAPECSNEETVQMMIDAASSSVGVMQKSLERAMAAKNRKGWDAGRRRGRINPGALFRTSTGDDRVFRQRYETKAKNTVVSLLCDCSGSMDEDSKLKTAGIAMYAISSTLERLRIQHEALGFTTTGLYPGHPIVKGVEDEQATGVKIAYGRLMPIYMPVFKTFHERLSSSVLKRMAALQEDPDWTHANVDGESVQIAAHRLVSQRAERHVLIVLSDGMPSAYPGHGAAEHLKATVKKLEASGVEVIGIGLGDDAVKSFYRKSLVLRRVSELPTTLIGELTKLLLDK